MFLNKSLLILWMKFKLRSGFWCPTLLQPLSLLSRLHCLPLFFLSLSFLILAVCEESDLTHTNHQCLPARTEKELQHYSNLLRILPPKSHRDGGEEGESSNAGSKKGRKKAQERSLQVVSKQTISITENQCINYLNLC